MDGCRKRIVKLVAILAVLCLCWQTAYSCGTVVPDECQDCQLVRRSDCTPKLRRQNCRPRCSPQEVCCENCCGGRSCVPRETDGGDDCFYGCADGGRLVCGSDGITYDNGCRLAEAICRNPDLTMAHKGACDSNPCDSEPICTQEYEPICGSDGETYGNECLFNFAKRCVNHELEKASEGECDSDPCDPLSLICTQEYDPICGSDGETYGNECLFDFAQRCVNQELEKAYEGECDSDPCDPLSLICTEEYDPICGSDGKTYENECLFDFAQRCVNHELEEAYEGECEEEDPCDGPQFCTLEINPVCGSNGVTYGNECLFERARDCIDPSLTIVKNGRCDLPEECVDCRLVRVACTDELRNERCTSCSSQEVCCDNCCGGQTCVPERSEEEDPCDGPQLCTLEYNPVCGSNGVTYGNTCQFNLAKKCSDSSLTIVKNGRCDIPAECVDCALIDVPECTDEYRNPNCDCSSDEVCCDDCCGGKVCRLRNDGPCNLVECPIAGCPPGFTIAQGPDCCPICVPLTDCSAVLCLKPDCPEDSQVTNPAQPCCRICRTDLPEECVDCRLVRVACTDELRNERCTSCSSQEVCCNNCCGGQTCVPERSDPCANVLCVLPECDDGFIIDNNADSDECCPERCVPDCSRVLCPAPNCPEDSQVIDPDQPCCKICQREEEDPCNGPQLCTLEYNPVCGSNGVTYGNKCQFNLARTCTDTSLTIVKIGRCDIPAECVDCDLVDAECTDENRNPNCDCSAEEVCCDDCCGGKVCRPRNNVPCDQVICPEIECSPGFTMRDGPDCCPICVPLTDCSAVLCLKPDCPEDSQVTNPAQPCCRICRTDLPEECVDCRLARVACTDDLRNERCTSCNSREVCCNNCCGGQTCVPERSEEEGPCDGPPVCTLEYNPLCGSNGVTYGNTCQFKWAKKCTDPSLTIVKFGRCEKEGTCPPRQLRPCVEDGPDNEPACLSDADCKGSQKCCPGVCNNTCQNPREDDCSAVLCITPICPAGWEVVNPEEGCCPVCREIDPCRDIDCDVPGCPLGFAPGDDDRSCCPGCIDCRAVRCGLPNCPLGSEIVKEGCCPVCRCPDGSTPVNCLDSPCETATCAAFPEAECVDNFCGGCNADWFVDGEKVDCDVPLCPDGSNPFNCLVRPCRFATCEAYPDAICLDNYCGGCNADFYIDGELVNCNGCPDGSEPVNCFASPCETATCAAFPEAECVDNFCGGCNADWFVDREKVECDVCNLPIVPGPCRGYFPMWGYQNGRCEEFTYGGCGGNGNRFSTERECEKQCNPDVCSLPIVPGPCKAYFPSWGFQNGRCEEFIYGGCGGNGNRFLTEAECLEACDVCSLPIVPGPCKAYFPSWGFQNGRCEEFIYGGCEGNGNRFSTESECEEQCNPDVCSLPIVPGPCRGSFPRWGFQNGRCEEFIYGGCGGNGNRFSTEAECLEACNVCELPLERGPCKAYSLRWGFRNGRCEKFIYGGCQGNANRFSTKADCDQECVCGLPLVTGPCEALIPRWGFHDNQCVQFTYGGCDGNANNFESRTDCNNVCGPN